MTNTPKFTNIMGQDHMLAYINKAEADMLKRAGGAGVPVGPAQIPAYFFFGGSDGFGGLFSGDSSSDNKAKPEQSSTGDKKTKAGNQVSATGQYAGDGYVWNEPKGGVITRTFTGEGNNGLGKNVIQGGTSDKGTKETIALISSLESGSDPDSFASSAASNSDDISSTISSIISGKTPKSYNEQNLPKFKDSNTGALMGDELLNYYAGGLEGQQAIDAAVNYVVNEGIDMQVAAGGNETGKDFSKGLAYDNSQSEFENDGGIGVFYNDLNNNKQFDALTETQATNAAGDLISDDIYIDPNDKTGTNILNIDYNNKDLDYTKTDEINQLLEENPIKTKLTEEEINIFSNDDTAITTCPTPDMPILMADRSTKPAGDIRVGDFVYTAHEKTMSWGVHEVTRAETVESSVVKLFFTNNEITCSPNHKIYRGDIQDWVEVKDLEYGDRVVTQEGTIEFLSRIPQDRGKVVILTIKDAHTYICGGILSHNKSPKEVIPVNNNDDDDDDGPIVPIVNQALLDARARRDAAYLAQQGNITNAFGFANDGYYDGLKENYLNDSEGIFKTAYDDAERGLYDVFKSAGLLTQSGVDQSVGKLEGALGTEEGRLGGLSDEYRSANKGFVEGGRGSINSGLDALKFFSEDVAEVNTQTDNINAYDVAGLSGPYKTPKDQDIADFFTDFAKRKYDPSYNVDPSKTASSKAMRIGAASTSQPSQLLGIKSPYSGKSVKVIG